MIALCQAYRIPDTRVGAGPQQPIRAPVRFARAAPLASGGDPRKMLILEIIVVLALFVLNGFFAMAELAIVSSRRAHLERLAKEGRPGAQVALALADDPARMLAAVQIGFTTSAMLAGIFSGATLADRLEAALLVVPVLADYGKPIVHCCHDGGRDLYRARRRGAGAQVHRLEQSGSSIAIRVAHPLAFVARVAAPIIWLLNGSTRLLLRLLHLRPRFERTLIRGRHSLPRRGGCQIRRDPRGRARHDRRRSRPRRQPGAQHHDPAAARAVGGPQRSQGANPRPSPFLPACPASGLPRVDR